jgi:uncharacterized protein (DUF2384 family)
MSYICTTKVVGMKSPKKSTKEYTLKELHGLLSNEAELPYIGNVAATDALFPKELSYKKFKAIMDKAPFTLSEWAALLQLSERTLLRYAKDGQAFNSILSERILALEQVINEGVAFFASNFKDWLYSTPYSKAGKRPMDYLYTHKGIEEVYHTIMRLQVGVAL